MPFPVESHFSEEKMCTFPPRCFLLSATESQHEEAGRNSGTDDTGHVGTHCVHQQEVMRIGLGADLLRNTRRHRYGRDAGRTDQRIDLAVRDYAQQLAQQHAANRGERERHKAKDNNRNWSAVS